MKRLLTILLATAFLAGGFALPAQAALDRVSTGLAANGFPLWYQDFAGLRLDACTNLDFCNEGLPFPPLTDPTFEQFYFAAEIIFNLPGSVRNSKVIMAIEGLLAEGTLAPVVANVVLIDLDDLGPAGAVAGDQYVVTTPYGTFTVTAGPSGGGRTSALEEFGTGPVPFADALAGPVGPFLRAADAPGGTPLPFFQDPVSGTLFLSNSALEAENFVTGAPSGNNFVSIVGPGVNLFFDQFGLIGQVSATQPAVPGKAEYRVKTGKFSVAGFTNAAGTVAAPTVISVHLSGDAAAPGPLLGTTNVDPATGLWSFTGKAPVSPAAAGLGQLTILSTGDPGETALEPLVLR